MMVLILGRSTKHALGGVEIFNESLLRLLSDSGVSCRMPEAMMSVEGKFIDCVQRSVAIFVQSWLKRKGLASILVEYSGFQDVLTLPILALSLKPIYVIAHVERDRKHLRNFLGLFLTRLLLRLFARQVFTLTDEQNRLLKPKSFRKVHTIVDRRFIEKSTTLPSFMQRYILFIGRVNEEKGVEDLIKAYSQVVLDFEDPPLLKIVGPCTTVYRERLDKLVSSLSLMGKVRMEGPIYDVDKKIEIIDASLFGVLPSHRDAFPLTVIEFFLRGRPCIASDFEEIRNLVRDDRLLVRPGETSSLSMKMKEVLQNGVEKDLLDSVAERARPYAAGAILHEIRSQVIQ